MEHTVKCSFICEGNYYNTSDNYKKLTNLIEFLVAKKNVNTFLFNGRTYFELTAQEIINKIKLNKNKNLIKILYAFKKQIKEIYEAISLINYDKKIYVNSIYKDFKRDEDIYIKIIEDSDYVIFCHDEIILKNFRQGEKISFNNRLYEFAKCCKCKVILLNEHEQTGIHINYGRRT